MHADDSVDLSHGGQAGRGRGRGGHSDTSRFVVNISGAGDGARSTVVEMADNQHQVSIIGTPRTRARQLGHVSRSHSSSSHVSTTCQDRTSPEGRSCGELEPDTAACGGQGAGASWGGGGGGAEDQGSVSFSSCRKYQTPVGQLR